MQPSMRTYTCTAREYRLQRSDRVPPNRRGISRRADLCRYAGRVRPISILAGELAESGEPGTIGVRGVVRQRRGPKMQSGAEHAKLPASSRRSGVVLRLATEWMTEWGEPGALAEAYTSHGSAIAYCIQRSRSDVKVGRTFAVDRHFAPRSVSFAIRVITQRLMYTCWLSDRMWGFARATRCPRLCFDGVSKAWGSLGCGAVIQG